MNTCLGLISSIPNFFSVLRTFPNAIKCAWFAYRSVYISYFFGLYFIFSRFIFLIFLVYISDFLSLHFRFSRIIFQIFSVYISDFLSLYFRFSRITFQIFSVYISDFLGLYFRFSQFFHEPLFTPSATEREINAVNSENDKNLQNDSWRIHQLEKSLAKPTHDFYKFGTGM